MTRQLFSGASEFERTLRAKLVVDGEHYTRLVAQAIANAKISVWIATANVKEIRIEAPIGTRARARGQFISILEMLEGLANRGVELRLLHAAPPSRAFRTEFNRRSILKEAKGLQIRQCPRVHFKLIVIDGRLLYIGSANFTGAGLGARAEGRRNFEIGLVTEDDVMLDVVQQRFERVWTGAECKSCKLRRECPAPIDRLVGIR